MNNIIDLALNKCDIHHADKVTIFSFFLASKMNLPKEFIDNLLTITPLHDIGKLAIPQNIINKPSKLSKEEFKIVQGHSELGNTIFENYFSKEDITKIILQHHENIDGTGYPDGLKGDEITLYAKIVSICDVYDALVSKRCYKEPWTHEDALEYIKSQENKKFNAEIVQVFVQYEKEIKK